MEIKIELDLSTGYLKKTVTINESGTQYYKIIYLSNLVQEAFHAGLM